MYSEPCLFAFYTSDVPTELLKLSQSQLKFERQLGVWRSSLWWWETYDWENFSKRRPAYDCWKNLLGYVYVASVIYENENYYKIGASVNPVSRLKLLTKQKQLIHSFIDVIKCHDYFSLERTLHEHFSNQRFDSHIGRTIPLGKEYFYLSQSDIELIKQIKFFDGQPVTHISK